MSMSQADAIRQVIDRQAIADTVAIYARGVDRRDWDLVRTAFHPDAFDDHGDYKGGVDGFIAWVSERHALIAQSMHFLGNMLIEFAGENCALVETYFVALQRLGAEARAARGMPAAADGSDTVDMETIGRYIDRFERRDTGWRIAQRTVAYDAIKMTPASGAALKPTWALSRRDPADPLHGARRELGLR